MSPRARRFAAALAAVVVLLFAGRWTSGLLADRWWAAEVAPSAVRFLTDWHLLRLTLEAAGVLIAATWFIGHLLVVYRAIGSVQIPRNVANLEFREALTPRVLLTGAVATGAVAGLIVGAGSARWWSTVALAWHGAAYGIPDPVLGNDLGLYVAQLPAWHAAHAWVLLLVLLALGGVAALYVVVGAIQWIQRRPAINDHARAHLGWLFVALALVLAWGYALEPYELVAGAGRTFHRDVFDLAALVAPALVGTALMVAVLSAVWAVRPQHALAAAGWVILGLASVAGHWILPSVAASPDPAPAADVATLRRLDALAYGLENLRDSAVTPAADEPTPPPVPSFFNALLATEIVASDTSTVVATDPALVPVVGADRPAWLTVRALRGGSATLAAIADDRVSAVGDPLFYRLGDSIPSTAPQPALELQPWSLRPEAEGFAFRHDGRGVSLGSLPRRVVLAWALQAGRLLAPAAPGARITWRLDPGERLGRLAPFADWSPPSARLIGDRLIWIADGNLPTATFPLTSRVLWRQRQVGGVRAAYLGTVDALTGETHVYLRTGADPLAQTWSSIAAGVVEPPSATPAAILAAAPYPAEVFRTQAGLLDREPWAAGTLTVRGDTASGVARAALAWEPGAGGPEITASYERAAGQLVSAVLVGARRDGAESLTLLRYDSTASVPVRVALENRWKNFPSFGALAESLQVAGSDLRWGPLHHWRSPAGLVAYETLFAVGGGRAPRLVWVNVAAGRRLGAGRSLADAWSNLRGRTVPIVRGPRGRDDLSEARHWMRVADSALRRGEWSEVGRALDSLRRVLGIVDSDAP